MFCEMCQSGVSYLGSAQVQTPELLPVPQNGKSAVTNLLGVIEVKFGNIRYSLQIWKAQIADAGVRQIQKLQFARSGYRLQIGVRDPGAAQAEFNNVARTIRLKRAAVARNPCLI